MIKYFLVVIALFLAELLYFEIARRYNIVDNPNQRSSHTEKTLRGGGIIFYISVAIYFCVSNFEYSWFFLGLSSMVFISFLDDIFTLSNKIRLFIHFLSVALLANELGLFQLEWYYLLISFVLAVGTINAYNFMDGINGMTACYSLCVGGLLMFVNDRVNFIDADLLVYSMLGVLVFAFFNFRIKAKCFAGDVGSVAIAYILLFGLGSLITKTGNFIYFLFLAVYGIDVFWTIVGRLYLRQNIFEAHRTHLYQYLANEGGINKLWIAIAYALLQVGLGGVVIGVSKLSESTQVAFSIFLLIGLSCFYLIFKRKVVLKYLS